MNSKKTVQRGHSPPGSSPKGFNPLGVNPLFIEEIQPKGGLSFKDERYVKAGDGYQACIHIYEYPKSLNVHWMARVLNLDKTIASVDISTEDTIEVKKNINRSMKEQQIRYSSAKDATDAKDAQQRYQELDRMYDEISSMGEIVKLIHIRLFVSAKTVHELDDLCKGTMNYLESNGYRSAIYLNESKNEWKSLFTSYTEQSKNEYRRYGQPILAGTLAGGDPFHFTSLSDPTGTFYGTTTQSGGSVLFDPFTKTQSRLSYNTVCVGKMGSGKSTLLKKILTDQAIRGNYIRGFDPTGEFQTLVDELGGKSISLDGTDGILNPLEILKTDENESVCFARHMSKLKTIYKFLVPGCDMYDTVEFEQLLHELYEQRGLHTGSSFTGLPPDRYPVFSDLNRLIDAKISAGAARQSAVEKDLTIQKMRRLGNIRLVIGNLVDTYGHIFNGHSTLENVMHTQIVFFNIKNLSLMKEEIFDAQLFNALSLCWDNCVQIGMQMKNLYDAGEIRFEDITRFTVMLDEAHRIINTNKLTAVEQLTVFSREARKFFGGLIFASQSIRDFVPDGSGQDAISKLVTLFELTQYKVIMNQDGNALPLLNRVFKSDLSPSELDRIPMLSQGECILSISGDSRIEFKIEITEQERQLFRGGA